MVDIYITDQKTRNFNKIEKPVKGCWINMVSPTDNEIRKICNLKSRCLKFLFIHIFFYKTNSATLCKA